MTKETQRGWFGYRNSDGTERWSPRGFFQNPTALLRSDRSLAGPLRMGTARGVGPRGGPLPGGSDLGMDRVSPRGFDPMGTCDTRAPAQESSELVSREVRKKRI
jgi:hypothetical protein